MPKFPVKSFQLLFLVSLVVAQSVAASTADDFYLLRLRVGEEAFRHGQALAAAEDLRIACFGLLDQPVLLSEGIAYLALVQSKLGRTADVDATLFRFAEVERKFGALKSAELEPATRKEFVALARARLSPEVVKELPGLNPAAPTTSPTLPATRTASPSPTPAQPPPSPGRGELKEQLERDVLAKQWLKAAAIVPQLEPFAAGEEVWSFYAAIATYEGGNVGKAKALAKPAAGKVAKSPYVEYYLKKIVESP